MRELLLDASQWMSSDDLYLSFFAAVKAPAWHGRNLNALHDSIAAGDINEIEVPYRLVIKNYHRIPAQTKEAAESFIELVDKLKAEGVPIEVRIEN